MFLLCGLFGSLPLWGLSAKPLDLDTIFTDENPEALFDRLAADPFATFGPEEWSHPFRSVDFYRAVPACTEAMKQHPDEARFKLGAAIAFIAGQKNAEATKLLEPLIAEGNSSAMLALALISPEAESAGLMRKAADVGNPNAMMLYGMSLMTGKGVSKDSIAGVRMIRRAAEAGSTCAMLLLANFYNHGTYGVGLNPEAGKKLIDKAASLGDPAAKEMLASLAQGKAGSSEPQ
ncbi:MAG: tetratricopeptide repeat protein [Methyloceanibacter sp.]